MALLFLSICGVYAAVAQGVWTKSETPRFRNANAVWMRSTANIVIAGGWLTNDSVSGIYTSKDSGKTWEIRMDDLGGQLSDLYFTSNLVGYACGKNGRFVTTSDGGANWSYANLSPYVNSWFRSLVFSGSDSCWMAGGPVAGDNQALVLFSADKGKTWKKVLDSATGMLKSVSIAADGSLWACGVRGILYKSTDKGSTWSRIFISGHAGRQQFNTIDFDRSGLGLIAGGSGSGDSVQVIFKTSNSGGNWTVIRDTMAPPLNGVFMLNESNAYAVGNQGAFVKSVDAGSSWEKVSINPSLNDVRDLQDVFYINPYNGIATGSSGKTLEYSDKNAVLPKITLSRIFVTSDNKIRFEGQVNPEGLPATTELHYGPDPDMNIVVSTGSFNGSSWLKLSKTISVNQGFYYAKLLVTTDAGTTESSPLTYYAGQPEIPNFDFEFWNTNYTETFSDWQTNGIIRKYKFSPLKNGLEVQYQYGAGGPGAVLYADTKYDQFRGGVPFHGNPDTVKLRCRYNIANGDSAALACFFKDNSGTEIYRSIQKWTGKKMTDTVLSFPMHIPSGKTTDTLMIVWMSTNYTAVKMDSASHLYLDTMWFTGTNARIPNMGFDLWDTDSIVSAVNWYDPNLLWNHSQSLFRSKDAHSRNYAAHLFKQPASKFYPAMYSYPASRNPNILPSFKITRRYNSLKGYYKFKKGDYGDSVIIRSSYFRQGQPYGWSQFIDTIQRNAYTSFSAPISYTGSSTPDSAAIQVYLWNERRKNDASDAELWLDQLSFENYADSVDAGLNKGLSPRIEVSVYPNPGSGMFFVSVPQFSVMDEIQLFNACGSHLFSVFLNGQTTELDLSAYPSGTYVLMVKGNKGMGYQRVVLTR